MGPAFCVLSSMFILYIFHWLAHHGLALLGYLWSFRAMYLKDQIYLAFHIVYNIFSLFLFEIQYASGCGQILKSCLFGDSTFLNSRNNMAVAMLAGRPGDLKSRS